MAYGHEAEDAETTVTRRELKQMSIPEQSGAEASSSSSSQGSAEEADNKVKTPEKEATEKDNGMASPEPATPDRDTILAFPARKKEQIGLPKKKRAHDNINDNIQTATDRTDCSEPEAKRARVHETEKAAVDQTDVELKDTPSAEKSSEANAKEPKQEPKAAASSAFVSSPFATLASSSSSSFGAPGSSGKSMFGASSVLPFSALGESGADGTLVFGRGTLTTSPFASNGLNGAVQSNSFGGGSAFGNALSGAPRLTSFASTDKPGTIAKSEKPFKPFGAPESDAEDRQDNYEDEDGEVRMEADGEAEVEKEKQKEKEEPKKQKLQKIVVDDGESHELTLLGVRAKIFHLDKDGWKERGAGILKLNVPKSSVVLDKYGDPLPETFDASMLEDGSKDGAKSRNCVRLVMRQDHTLRLLLNTTILPATKLQTKNKVNAAYVLFIAVEDGELKQIQLKMSQTNAVKLINTVELVQRELASMLKT